MNAIAAALLTVLLLAAGPAHSRKFELEAGGRERDYRLYVPPGAGQEPMPLVVVLHGALGSGEQAEDSYGWNAVADARGLIVAYPDGVRRTWNAGGGCCGRAARDSAADVAFLDRLIGTLVDQGRADPARVYLAGISNGGAMAYRYACEGGRPVAAIGSVAGAMTFACPSPRPVSVMEIHGLQDRTIPIAGGEGRRKAARTVWPAADTTLARFRAANDCGEAGRSARGPVERTRWSCAEGRAVELITIAGAGHQWPGSDPHRGLGARLLDLDPPSNALDATAVLADFFAENTP